jgi:ABC-type dipeptide/oligopeptide/nickel transport system permease subunit
MEIVRTTPVEIPVEAKLTQVVAATHTPRRTWFGRRRDPLVLVSFVFLALLVFVAVFADQISPYRPEFQMRGRGVAWQDPSAAHWLGTDGLGRDILSRLFHGARVSLVLGIGVAALQLSVGMGLGVISGYFGGWVDFLIMRVTDMIYAFPGLLLIILIVSMVGGGVFTAFVVLALVSWPDVCRLTRTQVLVLKKLEYVQAAQVLGASTRHIIWRHLFPNFIRPIAALVPLGIGLVILSEASLSFLGLGVVPPGASWGNMISDAAVRLKVNPGLVLLPGMCLVLTILALNYISDWLLDE